jgi:ribonuclease-3
LRFILTLSVATTGQLLAMTVGSREDFTVDGENYVLGELQELLGYRFHDRRILERALTHSSWRHEARSQGEEDPLDNEPLEFLGDAVLDLVVAQELFRMNPDAEEGFLTRARSTLVSTGTLAEVARELSLGRCLRLGRGEAASGGEGKDTILENTLEALLAAVLLDGGMRAAEEVVLRLFAERMERLRPGANLTRDDKSRLQELVQSRGLPPPVYRLRRESGLDHKKVFHVAVCLEGLDLALSTGGSKKEAQQAAARAALDRFAPGGVPDEEALDRLMDQLDGDDDD